MRTCDSLLVVKLGGSLLEDDVLRRRALEAVASAFRSGVRLVVVHGGGKRIDASLSRLGIPKRTVRGLRITDEPTREVVVSVLAGSVNKLLVAELQSLGVPAIGFSGADGQTVLAELHPPIDGTRLGYVGRVVSSSPALVATVSAGGFLPVIASLGVSAEGTLLNVNADAAASAIAVAAGATRLLYLTDVAGLLDDRGEVIARMRADVAEQMLALRVVSGGIVPKLQACVDALHGGVAEVVIAGPAGHAEALLEGMGGTRLVAA